MAKKRSVSTSRADRTEEKIKREKIKNSPRRPFGYPTNKKEALASATGVAAGAAIVAAKSRYARLTGGGAAPGRGMGQGGSGGGGFLKRSK